MRGVTQTELARISGVPQPVISAYETGRRNPTAASLSTLLDALDCDLAASPRPGIRPASWDVERSLTVDIERAGRLLPELLTLSDSFPRHHRGPLAYPRLVRRRAVVT